MTDEQIKVAIAEVCGVPFDICQCGDSAKSHRMGGNEHSFSPMADLPDYLNDLNAMHEAEETLNNDQWDDSFYHWIGFVVSGGRTEQLWEYRKAIVHATARQRAEAFLRTIGKWVESPPVKVYEP